ncbi:MAG: hypothetical protein MZV70_57690 [Desulfobacterales bacterium]|nr:hypothetical protein [Desulfobacterales bacterium]
MKGRKYGEFIAAEKYLPHLTIRMSGLDSFVMRDNPAAVDIELAQQGLDTGPKSNRLRQIRHGHPRRNQRGRGFQTYYP